MVQTFLQNVNKKGKKVSIVEKIAKGQTQKMWDQAVWNQKFNCT